MLEEIEIIGRLGSNPESRMTQTGKKFFSFPVAVFVPAKEEEKNITNWYSVLEFSDKPEIWQKGDLVRVVGRPEYDVKEDSNHKHRLKIQILANKSIRLSKAKITENEPTEKITNDEVPL